MAKGINKVQLLGNLGRDAEVKVTGGGTTVATFSLATAERVKQGGEWKDSTEWHNCVAFGRLAEIVRDYTSKGARLLVEGRLQTRSWDDKESGQKKYRTEIILADVTLLDGAKKKDAGDGYEPGYAYTRDRDVNDDPDIPF